MSDKNVGASAMRAALYGPDNESPKEQVSERSLLGKVPLGLDLTLEPQGPKLLRLKKGNITVMIPQAKYVDELEQKVSDLERKIAKLESANIRLSNAHNGLVRALADIKQELKKKINRNGI